MHTQLRLHVLGGRAALELGSRELRIPKPASRLIDDRRDRGALRVEPLGGAEGTSPVADDDRIRHGPRRLLRRIDHHRLQVLRGDLAVGPRPDGQPLDLGHEAHGALAQTVDQQAGRVGVELKAAAGGLSDQPGRKLPGLRGVVPQNLTPRLGHRIG